MRLLLDECIPARVAELMRAAGHDCVHVYDLGHNGQPDEQIKAPANADTDFGELLANAPVLTPSVILLLAAGPGVSRG